MARKMRRAAQEGQAATDCGGWRAGHKWEPPGTGRQPRQLGGGGDQAAQQVKGCEPNHKDQLAHLRQSVFRVPLGAWVTPDPHLFQHIPNFRFSIFVFALIPAVPVLIVGLQDADKIGHTRPITVFGYSRNLSIRRGLAPLPNPPKEIGDLIHGVLLQPTVAADTLLERRRCARSKRRPAGVTPPVLSCNCQLAGPVPLHCDPSM
jgi:hypothetical protein